MDGEVVVISTSKTKAASLFVWSMCFVAAGTGIIRGGDHAWAGWLCTIFFGLCVPVSIYMLACNVGGLRIDRNGVEMRTLFGRMKLAWSEVDSFCVDYVMPGIFRTKVIRIEFSESCERLRVGRQLADALSGMEGALANQFAHPVEEVCELLNRAKREWGSVGPTDLER